MTHNPIMWHDGQFHELADLLQEQAYAAALAEALEDESDEDFHLANLAANEAIRERP